MSTKKMMPIEGKNVFVGIDVHKKKYSMTAIVDKVVIKRCTSPANPRQFAQSLQQWFAGASSIRTVYEAGFSGFGLHRILTEQDILNLVINPASLETAANNKVKTDKRDSEKMARHLEFGNLQGIRIPTEQEELQRLAQRTRSQYVAGRVRIGNQIKSKLFQFGWIGSENDRVMSLQYISWIQTLALPLELKEALEMLIDSWKEAQAKIKQLDQKILLQNTDNPVIEKIQSVPGIGSLSANILYTELGNMKQFANEKSLFSYVGLTPSEYSSGETVRKGRITRQGPSRLRHILTEAAWRAKRADPGLQEIFIRISARRGTKRGIIAIARKLIGRVRACVKNEMDYTCSLAGR